MHPLTFGFFPRPTGAPVLSARGEPADDKPRAPRGFKIRVSGMRPGLLAGLIVWGAAHPGFGQWMPIPGEDDDPLPTAEEIMRQVRDAFPEEPLLIQAKLERRGAPPSSERSYRVQIVLRWNEAPPNARILLADAFGSPLAETRVWYREDGAEFRVPVGDAPHPDAKIFDTDFTWGDLALSFLWWTGGELLGFESRRGRRCYVVDFPHPDPSRHAHVLRLWIDAHVYALLQAEVRDARGDALRRLSVRSLRRVGLRWTLEDLEMRDLVADTRTRLRVEELYALEESLPEAAP